MKIITLEEHFQLPETQKAIATFLPISPNPLPFPTQHLEDLGAGRLKEMDAMGIDVQVLSYASAEIPLLPASEAVPIVRAINDQLAQNTRKRWKGRSTCCKSVSKSSRGSRPKIATTAACRRPPIGLCVPPRV